ncbi:MAG: AI-2E family transporter [Cellvibrionaceae bacterium]|nr:AI-2E family transporter [Cellvibrionaceae bacterium]
MNNSSSPVARFLLVTAAFIVVVAGMRAAASLLVPFLLSLFIAVVVTPLLTWLKNHRVPGALAIVLIMVLVVVFIMIIGAIVGSSIGDFRNDLPQYQASLLSLSDGLREKLALMGFAIELSQWREIFNPSAALTMAGNTLSSFGNVMTNGFLILLTVMFILAEEVNFAEKLHRATAGGKQTIDALHRFTSSVNKYMAIKTIISLATGFTVMLCLMLIGVDYPILWGLLAFLLNFIPTLGSILAAIPPVLLAVVQLGVGEAVMTALVYLAVNIIVGSVLEPRFMGKGLNLSSLVVFLSLVFWGWVLGSVGMLLSVPLTMTVKIALENFDDTRWMGVMLGSGATAAPDRQR